MKLRQCLLILICGFGLALWAPTAAHADTIGPTCANGCNGVVYTMTYYQTAAQLSTSNYTLNLVIDASGFGGPNPGYLEAIAPNVSGWSNAILTSAPGGVSDWSAIIPGGTNSGGCNGNGTPFFCNGAQSFGAFNLAAQTNSQWDFTWTLDIPGVTPGSPIASHLKAVYSDANGNFDGTQLSQDMNISPGSPTTPVPEPATWALLLTGVLAAGWVMRRGFVSPA